MVPYQAFRYTFTCLSHGTFSRRTASWHSGEVHRVDTILKPTNHRRVSIDRLDCVCVCVFFPFILDIKLVGRTSRGHTGGRSHRISHTPSFCGACLNFSREKDSVIPFPRRPSSRILCTNDLLIVLHPLGIFILVFSFSVRKIRFAGIELTSQRVGRIHSYLSATGATGRYTVCLMFMNATC